MQIAYKHPNKLQLIRTFSVNLKKKKMKRKSAVSVKREVEEPAVKQIISAAAGAKQLFRLAEQRPQTNLVRNRELTNRIVDTAKSKLTRVLANVPQTSTAAPSRMIQKVALPAASNQVVTVIDKNRAVSNAAVEAARKRGRRVAMSSTVSSQRDNGKGRIDGKTTIVEEVQAPKVSDLCTFFGGSFLNSGERTKCSQLFRSTFLGGLKFKWS